eukprot:566000_1
MKFQPKLTRYYIRYSTKAKQRKRIKISKFNETINTAKASTLTQIYQADKSLTQTSQGGSDESITLDEPNETIMQISQGDSDESMTQLSQAVNNTNDDQQESVESMITLTQIYDVQNAIMCPMHQNIRMKRVNNQYCCSSECCTITCPIEYESVPLCQGHHFPKKMLIARTQKNSGRHFYICVFPRHLQCANSFEWVSKR